jgi:hypothetical protein
MSERATEPQVEPSAEGGTPASRRWGPSLVTAIIMLAVSYLVFVLIPNNLLSYLTLHTNPRTRDLLIVIWWVAALVFSCWVFVRLQRGRVR